MNGKNRKLQKTFSGIEETVKGHFPRLKTYIQSPQIIIKGVYDGLESMNEEFEIEVVIPENYPKTFPLLFETGGRIPRYSWRHIYSNDENCCLCVEAEQYKYFPKGSDIKLFFDNLVKPYFLNQLYYEINGEFKKERRHGFWGIYDFYSHEFNEQSLIKLYNLIGAIASGNIKGHHLCDCGSDKKRRDCHGKDLYRLITYITKQQARKDASLFLKLINTIKESKK